MCCCMWSLERLWLDMVYGKQLLLVLFGTLLALPEPARFGSAENVSHEIRRKEEVNFMLFSRPFYQRWLGVLVVLSRYHEKAAHISS